MDIEVQVIEKIQKGIDEVFNAIVDPSKMRRYFITTGSAPLTEGSSVVWTWSDYSAELTVQVKEVIKNQEIVFEWPASGIHTTVTISLEPISPTATMVSITESGWDLNHEGVKMSLEQCKGWTHMLCCMKAYLEFGINLRAGKI